MFTNCEKSLAVKIILDTTAVNYTELTECKIPSHEQDRNVVTNVIKA